jgi:hypothetical protein
MVRAAHQVPELDYVLYLLGEDVENATCKKKMQNLTACWYT